MNDKNLFLECNDGAYRALDGYSSTVSGILSTSLVYASNTEMLRISPDGFYVRGVKLEQDETEARQLFDALMNFMSGRELNKTQIRQEVIEERPTPLCDAARFVCEYMEQEIVVPYALAQRQEQAIAELMEALETAESLLEYANLKSDIPKTLATVNKFLSAAMKEEVK